LQTIISAANVIYLPNDFLKIRNNTKIMPKTPTRRNHFDRGTIVSKKNIALPNTEKSKLAMAIFNSLTR